MQCESEPIKVSEMVRTTYQLEGVRGFYKGLVSPLVSTLPYNSL